MRVRLALAAAVLAAVGVVATAAPAGAGSNGLLQVDAVVNGSPSSQLQIQYTCVGGSQIGPTIVDVNGTGVVVPAFGIATRTCTVEVVAPDGMVASFACTQPPTTVVCNPGNASVTGLGAGSSATAVITVTFDPMPPTPGGHVAAAIAAQPSTVG